MNCKNIARGCIMLMMLVGLATCSPVLREGTVTTLDSQVIEKYWNFEGTGFTGTAVALDKVNSKITSKFSVRNFVLNMRIKTIAGAEGFVLFHTPAQGTNIMQGYKVVINNNDYRKGSPQKTGSLSLIRNNFVRTASDDNWFDLQVIVRSNLIKVTVNNKLVTEYIEPLNPKRIPGLEKVILSEGFIILQKSNSNGSIQVQEIKIEPLSADLLRETPDPLSIDETGEALNRLNQLGFPVIDYHGHLKGGLTVEQVCAHGRISGYNYGISPNCGLNFPVTNDSSLVAYFAGMEAEPVFKAMQCEGREWVTLFSPSAISKFDYIFTDAMTWTDHKGRRMRLWMSGETFVDEEQQFMEMLVGKIEAVLYNEPVDVHVNPTYLPAAIAAEYDRLWTPERMDRVIKALKENDVALEINARFKIPSIVFIKRAKAAGIKFTLGTNNADNTDLNRLEYCLKAIGEAGIKPEDIFLPRPSGDKKVLKKGLPSKITG